MPKQNRSFLRKVFRELETVRCEFCGKIVQNFIGQVIEQKPPHDRATVDHILPKSSGGSNANDNLAVACYKCNHSKASSKIWLIKYPLPLSFRRLNPKFLRTQIQSDVLQTPIEETQNE